MLYGILIITAPCIYAAAGDTQSNAQVDTPEKRVQATAALVQLLENEGVTVRNLPEIHKCLDSRADVCARTKKGWNAFHCVAVSDAPNRLIIPLAQRIIHSGVRIDPDFKSKTTPEGKSAPELAQARAVDIFRAKDAPMFRSRHLFLKDFRTNPDAAVPLDRVVRFYSANQRIAQEAAEEIQALKIEDPKAFNCVEKYLHDKAEEPRKIMAKL
jgi:hypothetical protein